MGTPHLPCSPQIIHKVPTLAMLTLLLESVFHSSLPESHCILQDPALADKTWTDTAVSKQQGQTVQDLMRFLLPFWQFQIPAWEAYILLPIPLGLRMKYIKQAIFPKYPLFVPGRIGDPGEDLVPTTA